MADNKFKRDRESLFSDFYKSELKTSEQLYKLRESLRNSLTQEEKIVLNEFWDKEAMKVIKTIDRSSLVERFKNYHPDRKVLDSYINIILVRLMSNRYLKHEAEDSLTLTLDMDGIEYLLKNKPHSSWVKLAMDIFSLKGVMVKWILASVGFIAAMIAIYDFIS